MTQYTHLSAGERNEIYFLLQSGTKQKDIAKSLGRNEGTISREISRNSTVFPKSRNGRKSKTKADYHYLPDSAEKKYYDRRKACGWRPPLKNICIMNYVVTHLRRGWSPDIIAGAMKTDHPDDPTMRISHECISQFIYSKKGLDNHSSISQGFLFVFAQETGEFISTKVIFPYKCLKKRGLTENV